MRKELSRALQAVIWLAGLGVVLFLTTGLLRQKAYFNSELQSPETETWEEFYNEEKNSLDCIFLGSSHVYNAINPVVFYEAIGRTGFDMATSSQDMSLSYYCLEEVLRRQRPEVVVLDTFGLFQKPLKQVASYKKTLDDMHWSSVKWQAVQDWTAAQQKENRRARVFTLLDYHDRWEQLEQADFAGGQRSVISGYCPIYHVDDQIDHTGYMSDIAPVEFPEGMQDYFDRICNLCAERGIKLVLTALPDCQWTAGQAYSTAALAQEKGLLFIDYNEDSRYASIGLQTVGDYRDPRHLNTDGANKMSARLAVDLVELGVLEQGPKASERVIAAWNQKIEKWNRSDKRARLTVSETVDDYLYHMKNSGFTGLLVTGGSYMPGVTEELRQEFEGMGCVLPHDTDSIPAICLFRDGTNLGNDYAEPDEDKVEMHTTRENKYRLILKAGRNPAEDSAIIINERQVLTGRNGLNLVVFDERTGECVDAVWMDLENTRFIGR